MRSRSNWHLQRSFANVTLPEELADTTIVVLGLLEMGYDDPATIAELLHKDNAKCVRIFLRKLKRSRNPVVQHCIEVGLPPGLCRPFPGEGGEVRCPICRNIVNQVPCPRCSLISARSLSSPSTNNNHVSQRATKCLPGTRAKLNVMKRRIARGLSPFHPQDAQFCEDPDEPQ